MGAQAGHKPQFDEKGNIIGPITRDVMSDPRYSLTLREAITQGCGKAHRGVVYAHYDFRNFTRGAGMPRGRVSEG